MAKEYISSLNLDFIKEIINNGFSIKFYKSLDEYCCELFEYPSGFGYRKYSKVSMNFAITMIRKLYENNLIKKIH